MKRRFPNGLPGVSRRQLFSAAGMLAMSASAGAAAEFPPPFSAADRLEQGPFEIEQDDGWMTIASANPSAQPIRNPGLGLVGYTWEESGPSVAARKGQETLEQHVDR